MAELGQLLAECNVDFVDESLIAATASCLQCAIETWTVRRGAVDTRFKMDEKKSLHFAHDFFVKQMCFFTEALCLLRTYILLYSRLIDAQHELVDKGIAMGCPMILVRYFQTLPFHH